MASSSKGGLSVIRLVVVTDDLSDFNHLSLQSSIFSGLINGLTIGVFTIKVPLVYRV